jgi:Natural resistance-associated macrophage protein
VDRDLAGRVLGDGKRHRTTRVESDRVRGQCVSLHPDWSALSHQVVSPTVPETESAATYWYFAIALFGAAMTPYEVFLSSGAVEEHWTVKDLVVCPAIDC